MLHELRGNCGNLRGRMSFPRFSLFAIAGKDFLAPGNGHAVTRARRRHAHGAACSHHSEFRIAYRTARPPFHQNRRSSMLICVSLTSNRPVNLNTSTPFNVRFNASKSGRRRANQTHQNLFGRPGDVSVFVRHSRNSLISMRDKALINQLRGNCKQDFQSPNFPNELRSIAGIADLTPPSMATPGAQVRAPAFARRSTGARGARQAMRRISQNPTDTTR